MSHPITPKSKFSTFPYLNLPEKSSPPEKHELCKRKKNTFLILKKQKRRHVFVRKMQQGGRRERSEGKKITIRQEIQREDKIGKEKGSVAFFRKTIKIIFLSKNWKQRNPREVVEKAGLFRRTNTDPLCFVLCVWLCISLSLLCSVQIDRNR